MTALARPWLNQYDAECPRALPLPERSMIDIFEQTALERPDAPAVHYFGETISFKQLNDYAERLAVVLRDWRVGKGDRVAVYMQNDPQFLIAQYGTWKRGSIVVPLNPMLKERELEYHIRDSGAKVLICDQSLFSHAQSVELLVEHIVTVDASNFARSANMDAHTEFNSFRSSLDMMNLIESATPDIGSREYVSVDDTAYIIYTSGTTGQPKGAINLHRNVMFNAGVYQQWMQMGPSDSILGIAPLFHVTAIVGHIALSAISGAPLILFHRFDPATVVRMIRQWQPTMTVGSITAFIALMNHLDGPSTALQSITKCYSGGAPIPKAVIDRFRERFGVYIHNIYGLTETNSPTHAVPLLREAPMDPDSGALSIGVPVPNCDVRVLDLVDSNREVPAGTLGELALSGPMVFGGYWGKDEETTKAFSADGYFLTGDVVRMDVNGWFYVVDRKKDMINASGFKVWPREVEDVLYQHPAVREAAVIGVPDPYRGETVKAVIALQQSHIGQVTDVEIIEFCKSRLATYKYPRQVEFVKEIPKTLTGKVLRRNLRR